MRISYLISNAAFLFVMAVGINPVMASTASTGMISNVLISQTTSRAYFNQNNARSAMPACATNAQWVFNYTTAQGQGLLAQLLGAYHAGKPLYVSGTNSCPDTAGYETVDYLTLP